MIQSTSGQITQFLADLDRIQATADRAQRQMSSGLKVQRPSDAPDQISEILQLRAQISQNDQLQNNLATLKSQTDSAESALQQAISVVEQATVLATQGSGGLPDAQTRASMAQQVRGLQQQLVGLSRTNVSGHFVFGGDQDQDPPYQLNVNQPNGVDRLTAASATRQMDDGTGVQFLTSRTAQEIFDHRNSDDTLAPDNVFAAINGLAVALENNDQSAVENSMIALQRAGDYLNGQLGFYGAVQKRVSEAASLASKFQIQQQTSLSDVQDADLSAAIVEMTQAQTQQQAALSAQAQVSKHSLFDFLG